MPPLPCCCRGEEGTDTGPTCGERLLPPLVLVLPLVMLPLPWRSAEGAKCWWEGKCGCCWCCMGGRWLWECCALPLPMLGGAE